MLAALGPWVTAQLAETGRDGDGWCAYATCTEVGSTVSWAHGEGALVRGCPDTPGVRRFMVRLRTTKQTDPDHIEQLFIDIEDKDRTIVRQDLVTITPTFSTYDITHTANPDGLWIAFRTANRREDGTFFDAAFQYELVMAEDDDALSSAGDACNRPSPPPSPPPPLPPPPPAGYVAAGIVAPAVAIPTLLLIALFVFVAWMVRRERLGKPIFRQLDEVVQTTTTSTELNTAKV